MTPPTKPPVPAEVQHEWCLVGAYPNDDEWGWHECKRCDSLYEPETKDGVCPARDRRRTQRPWPGIERRKRKEVKSDE